MKKIHTYIFLLILSGALFTACKRTDTLVVATAPAAGSTLSDPKLLTSTLTLAAKADTVTTFSWSPVSYGVNTPINYTLQYDSAGKGFASPNEVTIGNANSFTVTQAMLNAYALRSNVTAGNKAGIEFRIKSAIGGSLNQMPVYSNVSTVAYTTYDEVVFWYVPGDYQGWNVGAAPKLGSTDVENYAGYIYAIPTGYPKFKITSDPDWNHSNYGDGGNGTLSTSGGDIPWPAPMPAAASVFYITVKKSTLKYTITPSKFTIAGDFNGWSASANELTYNLNNIYTFTTNFAAGGFKIVINGSTWSGGNGTGALVIGGGDNFPVTAGTHTVKVDMSNPPRYKVSVQ
ncbi:MAG: SusE domain-containing protein [Niabella sp.]|nr:SusE domain-containing protein [Niabella sp.]